MKKDVLVIACGNTLRSDDGFAAELVRLLENGDESLLERVEIEVAHQLTPEMAESASHVSRVIVVDAACGGAPGELKVCTLEPATAKIAPSGLTHDFDPETLLATTRSLFGATPELHVITVAGENFDHGENLSASVAAALPAALQKVRELIAAGP